MNKSQTFLAGVVLLASNLGFGQVECLRVGSTPEANASTLRAVAFSSDRFVAVGDGGIIVLSTNANNWLRQQSPTTSALYGLTFGGGRFVAVGDAGSVLKSTNGNDWLIANAGVTNNFRAIAFGNGEFVALTVDSRLMRSIDASAWDRSTNGVPSSSSLLGVYFGGGLFVACGAGTILVSSDGLNWTNTSVSTPATLRCGAYGNGIFVAAGWGYFGTGQVALSTNGVNWTSENGMNFTAFCFGGGLLVGVGESSVEWTPDANSWSYANVGTVNGLRGIAFGMGQYVAVGDSGAIFTTTNLSTWTPRNASVCPIQAFAEGNGISVGITFNCAMVYSSEDSIHYIQRRDCGGFLTSIKFENGLFVAYGSVGVLLSANGTNWTSISPPCTGPIFSMDYQKGVWVAVCQNIVSSVDLTNWTLRVENAGHLDGLIYGNERWVAFGWAGVIWGSSDGTNWLNHSFGTIDFNQGVFQDGLFSLYAPGVVSRDSIQWFDASISGPLLALRAGNSSSPSLTLAGEWGRNYLIRGSTNLSAWFDMQTITNTAGVTSVPITNSLNATSLFLRAVSQ